jgi:hypothetical protein
MKSYSMLYVISSRVENQIFVSKNAIEHICDTLIKLEVHTLYMKMQLLL